MIRIITDSVASIPADVAREHDITVATLYINRDGVEYEDATLDLDDFYSEIASMADNIPTSSQPSQLELETLFEEAAKAGDEVLGVFISSKLSGTYDGAVRAARVVESHNLNFHCILIDSLSCGYDEAWPVLEAVEVRDNGGTLEECARAVMRAVRSTRFLFTPDSLTFLQKGGRIGSAAALVGNLINLRPILSVRDGQTYSVAKVRTQRKALERIVSQFKEDVERHGLKHIMVHYIGDKAPALKWARDVIEPLVGHAVQVLPVSPVVGVHVGPAMGIAYQCLNAIAGKLTGHGLERSYAL